MSSLASFFAQYGSLLGEGMADTLVMLFVSTAFSYVIGIFLGVVLCVTAPRGLHPMRTLNAVLGWVVNIGRSIPFIILLVSMFPVTRALVGTTTGVQGVIPPLVLSTTPFVARMVEQSLAEVPRDAIEAAEAIAGAVGAGGLGDIAIRYGYYRYQDEVMIATLVLIIILVQVIQSTCDAIAKKIDHR